MKKNKISTLLRKTAVMVGLLGIVGFTALGPADSARADETSANDLVAQGIWAAHNKEGEETGKKAFDLNEMTDEELQFFGVFLSNYYVPYVTEFGTGKNKTLEAAKKNMVSVLQEQMSFSEKDSKALVDYVIAQTQQSSVKLEWGFSSSAVPGKGSPIVAKNNPGIKANLHTLHAFASGAAFQGSVYTSRNSTGDTVEQDDCVLKTGAGKMQCWNTVYASDRWEALGGNSGSEEEYNKAGLTKAEAKSAHDSYGVKRDYKNHGAHGIKAFEKVRAGNNYGVLLANGKPVFSLDLTAGEATPSLYAYATSLAMVDPNKGYGTDFFDAVDGGKLKDTLGSTVYGMDLYIDPFGSIIAVGENHQYVVVPGAMNPFGWKGIDADGKTPAGTGRGGVYNTLTLQQMAVEGTYPDILESSSATTVNATNSPQRAKITSKAKEKGYWWYSQKNAVQDAEATETKASELPKNTSIGSCVINTKPVHSRLNSDRYFEDNPWWNSGHQTYVGGVGNVAASYNRGNASTDFKNVAIFGDLGKNGASVKAQKVLLQYAETKPYNSKTIRMYGEGGWAQAFWGAGGVNTMGTNYLGVRGPDGSKNVDGGATVNCTRMGIAVDPLQVYDGPEGKEMNKLFSPMQLVSDDGTFVSGESFKPKAEGFIKPDQKYGEVANPSIADSATTYNMYFNYLHAASGMLGGDTGKGSPAAALGYQMDVTNFPAPNGGVSITIDEDALEDEMTRDIRNWTWYLLNPTEGFNYVTTLITNKSTHFLMNQHASMVGTTDATGIAGSTKYTGMSGYVTLPELGDLEWTDKLMDGYNKNYPYIVLGMVALLGIYAVVGVLTLPQALGSLVIFAVMALLPANLINLAVTTTNNVSNQVYGQKFMYWALVQNQTYSAAIDEASKSNSYTNYLEIQMQQNAKIDITGAGLGANSKGQDSVVVKWQSPKKMASLMINAEDAEDMSFAGLCETDDKKSKANDKEKDEAAEGAEGEEKAEEKETAATDKKCDNGKFTKKDRSALLDSAFENLENGKSGQSFIDDPSSTFLYRSYIDLNNYSRYIYKGIAGGTAQYNTTPDKKNWPKDLVKAYDGLSAAQSAAVADGYNNGEGDGGKRLRVDAALSSKIVSDAFADKGKIEGLTQKNNIGIDTRRFNFSLPAFTKGTKIIPNLAKNAEARGIETEGFKPETDGYTEKDYVGLAAYSVVSESPYFYFSWHLYDEGLSPENGAKDGYKTLILRGDGTEYFYNVKGNGELKDYLDMRTLFTNVIPYMKAGNEVVRDFDKVYGLKYEKGVPYAEGLGNDPDIQADPVLKQKYWKNTQISRLYGMYTPWVDLMYDGGYAEPETLEFQNGKITIRNPIDPASYPAERPMVFSKSEQVDYGLRDQQLTAVERKIIKVQSDTQESMFALLNMYNYNDNVLSTAAAMEATFAFNKAFSDPKVFGESTNLYPQSYELKNFSYDAYLRLILSESTGESISGDSANDFYNRIVQNSSMFTAIVLLGVDVTAVYLIPAFKLFLVIILGIVAIMMLLASVIRAQEGVWKNIFKSIVKPILFMMAIFISMALIVSAFMSNGNTGVTGYDGFQISLGDPVMVMLVMLTLNIIVLILMFILIKSVVKDIIGYGSAIFGSVKSVGTGTVGIVKGLAKGQSLNQARGVSGGAVAGAAVAGGIAGAAINERSNRRASERAEKNRGNLGGNGSVDLTGNSGRSDYDKGKESAEDTAAETGRAAKQAAGDTAKVAGAVVADTANNVAAGAQRVDKAGRKATRGAAKVVGAIPVAGKIIGGTMEGAVNVADTVAPVGGRKGPRKFTARGTADAVQNATGNAADNAGHIADAARGEGRSTARERRAQTPITSPGARRGNSRPKLNDDTSNEPNPYSPQRGGRPQSPVNEAPKPEAPKPEAPGADEPRGRRPKL